MIKSSTITPKEDIECDDWNSRTQTMKTQSSPESGYFNPRVFVVFLLWVCAAWLAAISFATPASAWSAKYAGWPGGVTWASENNPVIGMGYNSPGSASLAIYRAPTIGVSPSWHLLAVCQRHIVRILLGVDDGAC